jgi:predicted choloylglycine hydrolase
MDIKTYKTALAVTTKLSWELGELLATRTATAGQTAYEVAESANDLTSPWRVAFDTYNLTASQLWAELQNLPDYLQTTALRVAIEQAAVHYNQRYLSTSAHPTPWTADGPSDEPPF